MQFHFVVGGRYRYYQWLGTRRSGRCGAIALLKMAWLVAWDQWEHRNEVLYEEGRAETLKDVPCINQDIQRKLQLGAMDLWTRQHFYF